MNYKIKYIILIMFNDNEIKNILGNSIKDLRTQKGITQEKLAEFLNLQPQTIAKIETGKRFVSSDVLAKLCNYFNVEPYVLFLKPAQTYTPDTLDCICQINQKLKEIYNIVKHKAK